jgi:hypothetical protein
VKNLKLLFDHFLQYDDVTSLINDYWMIWIQVKKGLLLDTAVNPPEMWMLSVTNNLLCFVNAKVNGISCLFKSSIVDLSTAIRLQSFLIIKGTKFNRV